MAVDEPRRGVFQGVERSVKAAALLLFFDAAFSGSYLMSVIFCPVWFLVSLLKNAIQRPGWKLGLVRVGIPAVTLGVVLANDVVQRGIAETNARRVVAACEAYHAANGAFPKTLDELAPQYLASVPVAKHCLGFGRFVYINAAPGGSVILFWHVVPPHYRKIYNFEERRWSHLD